LFFREKLKNLEENIENVKIKTICYIDDLKIRILFLVLFFTPFQKINISIKICLCK